MLIEVKKSAQVLWRESGASRHRRFHPERRSRRGYRTFRFGKEHLPALPEPVGTAYRRTGYL